jgi:hypothetical protein
MRSSPLASLLFVSAIMAVARDASADELATPPPRTVSMMMQVIFGRPFASVRGSPELILRGLPELRQPQWWGPDPPKPPVLHVRLLRITF